MTSPLLSRRSVLAGLAAAPIMASAVPAFAATPEIFAPTNGVAIHGYDPVAYFRESKPVEGSSDYTTEYKGAKWHFSSQANLDAFTANPTAYAPQYGGYCAFAAAKGGIATTIPEAWEIVDGKLYLNYNLKVQGFWREDIPGFIAQADANWPGILNK